MYGSSSSVSVKETLLELLSNLCYAERLEAASELEQCAEELRTPRAAEWMPEGWADHSAN